MTAFKKKIPNSIGIFGASGHIGKPMARWLRFHMPEVRLRLITSSEKKVDQLRSSFPECEVTVGDYFDLPSVTQAVAGMEGLFVITPPGTLEDAAMRNLIAAIDKSRSLVHLIRVVGEIPNANVRRIPPALVKIGIGAEIQHPLARRLLDESDLPVTYFNIGASFMDNLLRPGVFFAAERKVVWPEILVPYIDPRDIGEAAARILIDTNARHLYQFHTLNNGNDNLCMRQIVEMMRAIFECRIEYDSNEDHFLANMQELVQQGFMPPGMPEFMLHYFRYEQENEVAWALNDFLERTLGRKPTTMRSWLQEHRSVFNERIARR